jgi:hypothetical protein
LTFIQTGSFAPSIEESVGILRTLDLGDVAAENEIQGLRAYFVETGQFLQARQGHARLVVGRKGSGKTAIFYEVRNAEARGHDTLILDLKPEGHQFSRLREFATTHLSHGLQEHTFVAFWTYLLLTELARKVLEEDRKWATRDPQRYRQYAKLEALYERHDPGQLSDFSQRLSRQVDRITARMMEASAVELERSITEMIFEGDVREITDAVTEYLRTRETVWVLVDNLDKGWPVRGATSSDILLIRSLLDSTRKLQHSLESRDVMLKCLVFLRSDIFELVQLETPDKGKDTSIRLDWEDPEQFEAILAYRIQCSTGLTGSFREMWGQICAPLIKTEDSFDYVVARTLMRPRDLLRFVHSAVDVAINRRHNRILEEDLVYAERTYSEDLLVETSFEIKLTCHND